MEWVQLLSSAAEGNRARSEFERDFDRIVFSLPFRMLQNKTQVFPLPSSEFIHSRMTHSLESSCVGRSLGHSIGEVIRERNPKLKKAGIEARIFADIVRAASLSHDIGNPPFGHAGEEAITEFYKDFFRKHPDIVSDSHQRADLENFDGNAQGMRLLATRKWGIHLSDPVLMAFTKYPRSSLVTKYTNPDSALRCDQKKFGFFVNEAELFVDKAHKMELPYLGETAFARHPLAFLSEAADDICYRILDFEDGVRLKTIPWQIAEEILKSIVEDGLDLNRYNQMPQEDRAGYLRARTINVLVQQIVEIFLDNEEALLAGTHDTPLISSLPAIKILNQIIDITRDNVYHHPPVLEAVVAGCQVIGGLYEAFAQALFFKKTPGRDRHLLHLLPREIIENAKDSPYLAFLSLNDFIAGMSDRNALTLYRKLSGIEFHPS